MKMGADLTVSRRTNCRQRAVRFGERVNMCADGIEQQQNLNSVWWAFLHRDITAAQANVAGQRRKLVGDAMANFLQCEIGI